MKRKKFSFVLIAFIVILLLYTGYVWVKLHQTISTFQSVGATAVEQQIHDVILQSAPNFSGTVLVARNGEPLFHEAYGYAKGFFGSTPNTPDTRFFLGSISKTFTATAVLALADANRLRLDDPITKFLPEYDQWSGITVKMLLNHTSGIENYYTGLNYALYLFWHKTPENMYEPYQNKPLLFTPGSSFDYSNTNYSILSKIIEIASGKSYQAYLEDRIFKPLALENTGYKEHMHDVANHALGHCANSFVEIPNYNLSNFYGSGSLYSTAEDLWRFLCACDAEKMFGIPVNHTLSDADTYGYGIETKQLENKKRIIFHTGTIPGISTGMFQFPDDQLQIVILSNNMETDTEKRQQNFRLYWRKHRSSAGTSLFNVPLPVFIV